MARVLWMAAIIATGVVAGAFDQLWLWFVFGATVGVAMSPDRTKLWQEIVSLNAGKATLSHDPDTCHKCRYAE